MFGLGGGEIVVIIIVALIVFGPHKLPEVARTISRGYKEWTKVRSQVDDTLTDLKREINIKAQLDEELAPVFRPDARARAVAAPPASERDALPVPAHDDYLAPAPLPADPTGDDYLSGGGR